MVFALQFNVTVQTTDPCKKNLSICQIRKNENIIYEALLSCKIKDS